MRSVVRPVMWMLGASVLFAAQAALVKHGLSNFGAFELVFYRSGVAMLLTLALIALRGLDPRTRRLPQQIGLGLCGFVSLALYFLALDRLQLATATTLNYTAPLFLLLLVWWLGSRRPGALAICGVVLGFVGVAMLLRPNVASPSTVGLWFGLISGATGGVAYLLLSRLGQAGEPLWLSSLYFSALGCALSGLVALVTGFSALGWDGIGVVVAIGVLATLAQWAMAAAYTYDPALVPASISYSTVVFSVLLGAALWGDRLEPASLAAIGMVVLGGMAVSIDSGGSRARAA
jgi:drug/metabolite transporter (DMT)-like permease